MLLCIKCLEIRAVGFKHQQPSYFHLNLKNVILQDNTCIVGAYKVKKLLTPLTSLNAQAAAF